MEISLLSLQYAARHQVLSPPTISNRRGTLTAVGVSLRLRVLRSFIRSSSNAEHLFNARPGTVAVVERMPIQGQYKRRQAPDHSLAKTAIPYPTPHNLRSLSM